MAFYNKNIAKNKTLRKAWRAAHQIKLDENEEICLPEICGEIARWMRRDRAPRNRLSLRSFSVLLCGALRLYRSEVNSLLKDTLHFSWTNRRAQSLSILQTIDRSILPADSSDNSEEESFVLMPKTIPLTEVTANNYDEFETSSAEPSEAVESDDSEDVSDDESTVYTVLPDDKKLTPKPIETADQGLQTSPCIEEPETTGTAHDMFDPDLPFGYVIVHDNYHSRIPSKIMFTSLDENVKFITK